MSLSLLQNATALGVNCRTSFQGFGGVEPYSYFVVPGGAGGSIEVASGFYTAPSQFSSDPKLAFDIVQVIDGSGASATAQVLVGSALLLVCDIIATKMNLDRSRVYLWDQKINEPTDSGLFVIVSVEQVKPFGNNSRFVDGVNQQYVNCLATVGIDIISRGPDARDRKEEILLALNSQYSEQQQEANSFYIGRISTSFLNLSPLDGAAIPYRYHMTFLMQYCVSKTPSVDYFNRFDEPIAIVNKVPPPGIGVTTNYETNPVGIDDWVVLIPKLENSIRAMLVYDSSGYPLEIGMCNYNAPANSEVAQFTIFQGMNEYVNIPIGYAQRISIRAIEAPVTQGVNNLNIFF